MKERIVIIGGMGPQASLELHSLILKQANARGAVNGDDFPEILHLSIPVKDFINSKQIQPAARRIRGALNSVRLYPWRQSCYSL